MRSTTIVAGLVAALVAGAAIAQSGTTIGGGGSPLGNSPPATVAPAGAGAAASGGSTQLYAVINHDGTTARGKGNLSSQKLGTGAYEVLFARDIRNCSYTATIGTALASDPPFGLISVTPRVTATNGVFVNTRSINGDLGDRPFHLYVDC